MITILVLLAKTKQVLSYRYRQDFHGYICNLLGNNHYKTPQNDYTYSNICGGRCTKEGIKFDGIPHFYIRTNSDSVLHNFMRNLSNTQFYNNLKGFHVLGFQIIESVLDKEFFETDASTPILVSKKYNHINLLSCAEINDTEKYLTESVFRKAKEMNIEIDSKLSIKITKQRMHRDIQYGHAINKGRNLVLGINCNRETKEFILLHGIGRSSSCGFGFLI